MIRGGQSLRGTGRWPSVSHEERCPSPFLPPPFSLRAPVERTRKGLAWEGIETSLEAIHTLQIDIRPLAIFTSL